MNVLALLRKHVGDRIDNSNVVLNKSYEEVICKVNSFPEPKNDFDRSYFQYRCTMDRYTLFQRIILNVGSFFIVPYIISKHKADMVEHKQFDAVFFSERFDEKSIPSSLRQRYSSIITTPSAGKMLVDTSVRQYMKDITKGRVLPPYFYAKVLIKLGLVTYQISAHNPNAIITYSESSFTTSLITKYCESKGIKYIGVMHGDRICDLKLSFFRCSEYYAWDQDYIYIFTALRCEKSQFKIEIPDSLKLPGFKKNENPQYDFTFYLQDENEESIKRLLNITNWMNENNYKYILRPHPLYFTGLIRETFDRDLIQDPRSVSLQKSFENTKNVIGRYSTTLYQAWYQGIPLYIDDYTMPELYNKLLASRDVIIGKPHVRLSELIGEKNEH